MAADGTATCEPCPPGTYKYQSREGARCQPCYQGRYAAGFGNTACRTCPIGTVSEDRRKEIAAQKKRNLELTDRHWGLFKEYAEPVVEDEAVAADGSARQSHDVSHHAAARARAREEARAVARQGQVRDGPGRALRRRRRLDSRSGARRRCARTALARCGRRLLARLRVKFCLQRGGYCRIALHQ